LYSNKPIFGDTATLTQMIKESIKKEIANELWTRQNYNYVQGACQWKMERTGEGFVGGLEQPKEKENQSVEYNDPYWGDVMEVFSGEPNTTYYADQMLKSLNGASPAGGPNDYTGGQGKSILYGIGTIVLIGLLFPSFGQKVQTVFTRTTMEGAELINKARSIVARAKEDIEDLIAEANVKGLTKRL
jgi:hypothetical protein